MLVHLTESIKGCTICHVYNISNFEFVADMLENHDDTEEKLNKKKRKLSSSQENVSSNQDISYIKVCYMLKFIFRKI